MAHGYLKSPERVINPAKSAVPSSIDNQRLSLVLSHAVSAATFKNIGSSRKSVMKNRHFSDSRQHASEDLQAQILLISQSVRASLDDPVELLYDVEFVVQDGRKRHAFLRDVVKRPPHVHHSNSAGSRGKRKRIVRPFRTGCGSG